MLPSPRLLLSAAALGLLFAAACNDRTTPLLVRPPVPAPAGERQGTETEGEDEDEDVEAGPGQAMDAGDGRDAAGTDAAAPDAGRDAGGPDARPPPGADGGLGVCASTFSGALTNAFGRIDGTVWAVQKPSDTQCVLPNDDHVIVQVLMKGAIYRMVVNVQSDRPGGDPRVRYATLAHALPPPTFAEGWHPGLSLGYDTTLDAHVADFTPYTLGPLVAKIAAEVKIGDPVAVYATSERFPESAHLVHRNRFQKDGAIVVTPTTAPKFLLFHFDEQVF